MIISREDIHSMYNVVSMVVRKKESPNQIDRDLEKLLTILDNAVYKNYKVATIPESLEEMFKVLYLANLLGTKF